MKYIISLMLLLSFSEVYASVEIEAFYREMRDGSGLIVYVALFNNGDSPVVLPTQNIGPLRAMNDNGVRISFQHVNPKYRDGSFLKVPVTSFEPVTLMPKERSFFSYKALAAEVRRGASLHVIYKVDAQLAKTYGFTECLLECDASIRSFFELEQQHQAKGSE